MMPFIDFQMLDILESFVKHFSYSYLRMDGATSIGTRQPVVEKFNKVGSPNQYCLLAIYNVLFPCINLLFY